MQSTPRDLDTSEAIDEMLDAFYRKVLADDRLRPLFLDVAKIDLRTHFGTSGKIKSENAINP